MAKEQAAVFRIEALDKASAVLNKVDQKLGKVGASATKLGKRMSTALTLPLAIIGAKAVSTFADFELSMAKVKAVSGATGEVFKSLEKDSQRLGAATKFSASEVAGLQLEYSKLGFNPDEILKVTEATLALAQATDEELAASAAVAGGTLRGFRLEAAETGRVADVMAKSFSSSALDLDKFGESMKYIAPVAAEAEISLEETTAMVSVLANNMIDGSMAGTSMRLIINKLAASGKPLGKVLEELGEKNIGLAEAERLVGTRAQTSLLILAKNTDKIKELTKLYKGAGGAAKDMAAIMDNTLSGAFARLRSSFEAALITVGKAITPILAPALDELTQLLAKVGNANPAIVATGVAIAGIAAVIGPVLIIVGMLVSSIGTIAGVLSTVVAAVAGVSFAPIIAGVAAVVAGVALVVEAMGGWGLVLESVKELGASLAGKFSAVWNQVKDAGQAAWAVIGESVGQLVRGLKNVMQLVGVDLSDGMGVLGKVAGIVLDMIVAQLKVVTKILQAVVVGLTVAELGALNLAKAAVTGLSKMSVFLNGLLESAEKMVNAGLSTVTTLIDGTLNKLAAGVAPLINGIINTLNELTGTNFAPIKLRVEGLDTPQLKLGRISTDRLSGAQTGLDGKINASANRFADAVDKLLSATASPTNQTPALGIGKGDALTAQSQSMNEAQALANELVIKGGSNEQTDIIVKALKDSQIKGEEQQDVQRAMLELLRSDQGKSGETRQLIQSLSTALATNGSATLRLLEGTVSKVSSLTTRLSHLEDVQRQMGRSGSVPQT